MAGTRGPGEDRVQMGTNIPMYVNIYGSPQFSFQAWLQMKSGCLSLPAPEGHCPREPPAQRLWMSSCLSLGFYCCDEPPRRKAKLEGKVCLAYISKCCSSSEEVEIRIQTGPSMVVHAFNPCTWEAEAGGFLSWRPAWFTEWVPGQPGLHGETLSRKTKNKQTNKQNKITKSKIYPQW